MSGSGDNDSWLLFPRHYRGLDGTCLVNLDAPERVGETHATRLILRFDVPAVAGAPLGDDRRVTAIDDALEKLESALSKRCGAAWVGRVRATGFVEACFYCRSAPLAQELALLAGLSCASSIAPDADWTYYIEQLAPSDVEVQWHNNRRVEDALRESGDAVHIARTIDHMACFSVERDAHRFADLIKARGFVVNSVEAQETNDPAPEARVVVWLSHTFRPLADELSPITAELHDAAEQCGGEYDGWETALAKR
jgi:hypothetical protein